MRSSFVGGVGRSWAGAGVGAGDGDGGGDSMTG